MATQNENRARTAGGSGGIASKKALLLGIAGTVAAAAWAVRQQQRSRRFADRGVERRNPMNFFLAGRHPHRRRIDRNGTHPLFERRQAVYDAY